MFIFSKRHHSWRSLYFVSFCFDTIQPRRWPCVPMISEKSFLKISCLSSRLKISTENELKCCLCHLFTKSWTKLRSQPRSQGFFLCCGHRPHPQQSPGNEVAKIWSFIHYWTVWWWWLVHRLRGSMGGRKFAGPLMAVEADACAKRKTCCIPGRRGWRWELLTGWSLALYVSSSFLPLRLFCCIVNSHLNHMIH